MKLIADVSEVFRDIDGYLSSKRVAFLLTATMIFGSWIANIFYSVHTDTQVLTAVGAISGVAGTGIAMERFATPLMAYLGGNNAEGAVDNDHG